MSSVYVAQAGGCTAVINATLAGVMDAASQTGLSVRGARYGVAGLLKADFIDLTVGRSQWNPSIIRCLPSSFLGSSRHKLSQEESARIVGSIAKEECKAIVLIGGNDTACNAQALAMEAKAQGVNLNVIAVPKTIDNDLSDMYFCPGYPSNARFIAETVQEAGLDSLAMRFVDRVKIVEVMGRNAGWLVAAAAYLKRFECQPPHILCLPEVAFDLDAFLSRVEACLKEFGFAFAVLPETLRYSDGSFVGEKNSGVVADGFGHRYVASPAQRLCEIIEERFHVRARYDKPGTIQRMSVRYKSKLDEYTAFESGRYALKLALEGASGVMVQIKEEGFGALPLEKVSAVERKLPAEFIDKGGYMVTKDFVKYLDGLFRSEDMPDYSFVYEAHYGADLKEWD